MKNIVQHMILFFVLVWFSWPVFSQLSPVTAGRKNADTIRTSSAPGYSILEDKYDVGFYFIDLEITNQSTYLWGSSTLRAKRVSAEIDTFVVELSQKLVIDSVFLQEKKQNQFLHEFNLLKLPLIVGIRTEENYKLQVFYHGNSGSGGFFSGISNITSIPWKQKVTYTLSEPFQGMDWFPVKQNLLDKADSSWVFITVDSTLKAGANGLLTNISDLNDGRKRFEWKSNYPVAYYLLSFSVADYIDYSFFALLNKTDSVYVQNYLYDSPGIDSVKYKVDRTSDLLRLYSGTFGTYPFIREKYGHCMAPMGGGMEHQTMTTIATFDFGLVAHELAHSWFGNTLTCGTWQDIWINEGFASYAEFIAIENLISKEEAVKWLVQAQNSAINFPQGAVYLSPEESRNVQRIFSSGLTYKKGGAIIHMLRYEINNDPLFFSILRDYVIEFENSNATAVDFMVTVEKHTGKDYSWFFDQWYYGKGFPYFITSWRQVGDTLLLNCSQTGSSNDNPFFKTHMDYRIHFKDGETEDIRVFYEYPEQIFRLLASKPVLNVQIDPESNVLKNAVVYKFEDPDRIFSVSPNPFKNTLNIVFGNNTKKHDIKLTGISGKVVYSFSTSSGTISLDLPNLSPGIYLLTVIEDGSKYTEKLISQ